MKTYNELRTTVRECVTDGSDCGHTGCPTKPMYYVKVMVVDSTENQHGETLIAEFGNLEDALGAASDAANAAYVSED